MSEFEKARNGEGIGHILPFFWQHHEEPEVLRKYMQVIADSHIKQVCVESRPHPDFVGPLWWSDMDLILEEAQKRDMKVWILDDSHFPSGYANGALKNGPVELHRQFVTYKKIGAFENEVFRPTAEDENAPVFELSMIEKFMMEPSEPFEDDHCLGFVGVNENKQAKMIQEGETLDGPWTVYGLYASRNRGPHRQYINMLDHEAVRFFLDTVYEPHYRHYKELFGNVIAGFFSDEPEIGNGHLYESGKRVYEMEDIPISREAEEELKKLWGKEYLLKLSMMFLDHGTDLEKANVRMEYMDVVTHLIEKNFSMQIGDWCRAHGVKYIGHLIEDHNQHTRLGSSLGHYFRGLKGQDWGGIDDIGGQVLPQMEDAVIKSSFSGTVRDGRFYHFTLGRLGPSLAHIDPLKKGNCMCEIFGAYGWEEGVSLEKYLIDHFLVRNVNHFVPHAFSPKAFPDPDCPPHFYAHGNNPQYRHFGALMQYTERLCTLFSNGRMFGRCAILYQAEADWSGMDYMKEDVLTRLCTEMQVGFDLIPSDVFEDQSYGTVIKDGKLKIGLGCYDTVLIPKYPFVREKTAKALSEFMHCGGTVLAVEEAPAKNKNLEEKLNCTIVSLEELKDILVPLQEAVFSGDSSYLRTLHYQNDTEAYMFVNESDSTYTGTVTVKNLKHPLFYDAWTNEVHPVCAENTKEGTKIQISIEPRKSIVLLEDEHGLVCEPNLVTRIQKCTQKEELTTFTRSMCTGLAWPNFEGEKEVCVPDVVEEEAKKFGGFIRYATTFTCTGKEAYIEVSGDLEGVEVLLNGQSLGLQVVPTYRYDLTPALVQGENKLEIISATTLERFVEKKSRVPGQPVPEPKNKLGLRNPVVLYWK